MKTRKISVIPSRLRLFLLQCRTGVSLKLRRQRKRQIAQTKASKEHSASHHPDPPSASIYLEEFGHGSSSERVFINSKKNGASPSVIGYLYSSDDAYNRLQGKQMAERPVMDFDARSGETAEDNFGVSVLTVDPSVSVISALALGPYQTMTDETQDTDEETLSTASKNSGLLEPEGGASAPKRLATDDASLYTYIQEQVMEKRPFNLAHFKAASESFRSAADSEDMSLYIQEESMIGLYTNFPNSFLTLPPDDEETAAGSPSASVVSLASF